MELPKTLNAEYIDEQYRKWKSDPNSVPKGWHFYFEGFELGISRKTGSGDKGDDAHTRLQSNVDQLIYRYRDLGHLLACMDPLEACPTEHPLLSLDAFQLSLEDLDNPFFAADLFESDPVPLKDIIMALKTTYCRSIGVEYMHLQDPTESHWLRKKMEPIQNRPTIDKSEKKRILEKLAQATLFEQYLNKKYGGVTRFSLEGGETIIPMLDMLVSYVSGLGCREIVLGMAHRGRLNVQTHILKKDYKDVFSEFESCYDPENLTGSGDVKYHNGYLSDQVTQNGNKIRIFLVNNPSHLESVNPVVEGVARARQDMLGEESSQLVLPLLIHGDAAFSGQGIVSETLNMSQLKGYTTGGTIHIIINNQIGYTTLPEDARSTRYSTDIAKILMIPIFHVHGENPEAAVHVIKIAAEYRNRFKKDVVVDLVCFRRYGHNEGDEPYFTQPMMYDRIKARPPIYNTYKDQLLAEKTVGNDEIKKMSQQIRKLLDDSYNEVHGSSCPFPETKFFEEWNNYSGSYSQETVNTGVDKKRIVDLAKLLNTVPDGFTPHRKLKQLMKKRLEAVENGYGIDWSNAELLAFATLVDENYPVRLSGQDCERGTFSQRHSIMYDRNTGAPYSPLHDIGKPDTLFQVYNSLLAEASVLGFEYGYSTVAPTGLTIWEAQFGDFVNNAQSVIDLFIASGQSKWHRLSGVVLLLPHGWDGLGPEHSSARLERFLQLCADDNMIVCNMTTPAQYFHMLRRQCHAVYRKPLIVMAPKSLLRHPLAISDLSELTDGSFIPVLDDPDKPSASKRVLFCSGKIYYQLYQHRRQINATDVALIRLEQLYPFPEEQVLGIIAGYKKAESLVWVQEEPQNMGAWQFIKYRLEALLDKPLQYVGRKPASSPATGFPSIYKIEQSAISDQAIGPLIGEGKTG